MLFRRRSRDQRGAAAVEFALILPIFLMLLFGIIDFGYMINRASMINNAARDGVREASFGVSSEVTAAEVTDVTRASLGDLSGATVSVKCKLPPPGAAACSTFDAGKRSGGYAVVEIQYQHQMLTPVGMFFPGGFDLTRKAEMRIE